MARCSRFSLYGDLLVRGVRWYARHTPPILEPFMMGSFTMMIFAAAPRQRRAIQRNLVVLLPGSGAIPNIGRSLRVFWNFACSLVDGTHALDGRNELAWEIQGAKDFETLQATPGGVIILTAHMGSYDIAGPVFAEKFGKKLHAVRLPEQNPEMQAFMESTRDRLQSQGFQIHYNRPGSMLAVELAQAIHAGDAVAIQGDRVLGEVAAAEPAFDARHAIRIPKGPFMLALATRAAMFPLFVIRVGWRRYRVLVRPALPAPTNVRNREASLAEFMSAWVSTLHGVARTHWHQWFVLEDAFVPVPEGSAAPAPLPADDEIIIPMPMPKAQFSGWETACGSMATTVVYLVTGWWTLHRLGLGKWAATLVVWPLLVFGLLFLTNIFRCVQLALQQLGLFRNTSPHRMQAWLHYTLILGLLIWWCC